MKFVVIVVAALLLIGCAKTRARLEENLLRMCPDGTVYLKLGAHGNKQRFCVDEDGHLFVPLDSPHIRHVGPQNVSR